jgi:hypothetical protein
MICEHIVTTGTVFDILGALSDSPDKRSIMINTDYGFVTVPVKDIRDYGINQKIRISIQISTNEKDSPVS